jgi:hypothetical protein
MGGPAPPAPLAAPLSGFAVAPDPEDTLTMIADMFVAIGKDGLDPSTSLKEVADIALQVIDMVRRRDVEIHELRELSARTMLNAVNPFQQGAYHGPQVPYFATGVFNNIADGAIACGEMVPINEGGPE